MSVQVKKYCDLFMAFLRIGLFGFGGGPTMIPLVYKEVVERYQYLDDEEFSNVLAIGHTLPGPIITKMGGYIGFRVGGLLGCCLVLIATLLPMVVVMIVTLTFLHEYQDQRWVIGMTQGVVPVVTWMMVKLTYDFFKKGQKAVGMTAVICLTTATLLAILWGNVHPGLVVFVVLVYAVLKPTLLNKFTKDKVKC
ncbi:chromate transporter [Vibrio sp.]|nr:chromate transporter [Vibrio sp.]